MSTTECKVNWVNLVDLEDSDALLALLRLVYL